LVPSRPEGVLVVFDDGVAMPVPITKFDGVIVKGAIMDEEVMES
jgi:hypothetical protein